VQHAFIFGGTGMLADVSLWFNENDVNTTVFSKK